MNSSYGRSSTSSGLPASDDAWRSTTTVGLELEVNSFKVGKMRIRCVAELYGVFKTSAETVLDEEKPRLASILGTFSSTGRYMTTQYVHARIKRYYIPSDYYIAVVVIIINIIMLSARPSQCVVIRLPPLTGTRWNVSSIRFRNTYLYRLYLLPTILLCWWMTDLIYYNVSRKYDGHKNNRFRFKTRW